MDQLKYDINLTADTSKHHDGRQALSDAVCGAEFGKQPLACLTLASFLSSNTGDVARRHIRDPELLRFIDIECYCWSTVLAVHTPMINAGMVFCDRHYGGINYPVGGVGRIPEAMAEGIRENGGYIVYKANVRAFCPIRMLRMKSTIYDGD